jgi:hypothetical protein
MIALSFGSLTVLTASLAAETHLHLRCLRSGHCFVEALPLKREDMYLAGHQAAILDALLVRE